MAGPLSLGKTLDRLPGADLEGTTVSGCVSGCDVVATNGVLAATAPAGSKGTPTGAVPDVASPTVSGCEVATNGVALAPALYCTGSRDPFFLPDKTHLNRKAF